MLRDRHAPLATGDDDYLAVRCVSSGAQLITGDDDVLDADLDPPALSPRALLALLNGTS